MCLTSLLFLPLLIFLPPPNFHANVHDFRPPSFFQGRRLRPCFNGVDAPGHLCARRSDLRKSLQTDGQTDRQTDDGRRAIALAHSSNELKA